MIGAFLDLKKTLRLAITQKLFKVRSVFHKLFQVKFLKLCRMITSVKLYTFIPVLVTLIDGQGHDSVQNIQLEDVFLGKFLSI